MKLNLIVAAILAAIVAATPAAAAEGGEVFLTIGSAEYSVTLLPDSHFSGAPEYPSVNLALGAPIDGPEIGLSRIDVGFQMEFGNETSGQEARLMRLAGDGFERLYCHDEDERGGMTVAVDNVSVDGNFLSVLGRFSCNLGTSENHGRTIDLSNPLPVSGRFSVTLEYY